MPSLNLRLHQSMSLTLTFVLGRAPSSNELQQIQLVNLFRKLHPKSVVASAYLVIFESAIVTLRILYMESRSKRSAPFGSVFVYRHPGRKIVLIAFRYASVFSPREKSPLKT